MDPRGLGPDSTRGGLLVDFPKQHHHHHQQHHRTRSKAKPKHYDDDDHVSVSENADRNLGSDHTRRGVEEPAGARRRQKHNSRETNDDSDRVSVTEKTSRNLGSSAHILRGVEDLVNSIVEFPNQAKKKVAKKEKKKQRIPEKTASRTKHHGSRGHRKPAPRPPSRGLHNDLDSATLDFPSQHSRTYDHHKPAPRPPTRRFPSDLESATLDFPSQHSRSYGHHKPAPQPPSSRGFHNDPENATLDFPSLHSISARKEIPRAFDDRISTSVSIAPSFASRRPGRVTKRNKKGDTTVNKLSGDNVRKKYYKKNVLGEEYEISFHDAMDVESIFSGNVFEVRLEDVLRETISEEEDTVEASQHNNIAARLGEPSKLKRLKTFQYSDLDVYAKLVIGLGIVLITGAVIAMVTASMGNSRSESSLVAPPTMSPAPTVGSSSFIETSNNDADSCGIEMAVSCAVGAEGRFPDHPCDSYQPVRKETIEQCLFTPYLVQFRYTGSSCLVPPNNATRAVPLDFRCQDYSPKSPPKLAKLSFIVVSEANNKTIEYHRGWVAVGDVFQIRRKGDTRFTRGLRISIYRTSDTSDSESLLQRVIYKPLCSNSLEYGGHFGASQFVGFANREQGKHNLLQANRNSKETPSFFLEITNQQDKSWILESLEIESQSSGIGYLDETNMIVGKNLRPKVPLELKFVEKSSIDLSVRQTYPFLMAISARDVSGRTCRDTFTRSFIAGRDPAEA